MTTNDGNDALLDELSRSDHDIAGPVYSGIRKQTQFEKIKRDVIKDKFHQVPKVHRRAKSQLRNSNVPREIVMHKAPVTFSNNNNVDVNILRLQEKVKANDEFKPLVFGSPKFGNSDEKDVAEKNESGQKK